MSDNDNNNGAPRAIDAEQFYARAVRPASAGLTQLARGSTPAPTDGSTPNATPAAAAATSAPKVGEQTPALRTEEDLADALYGSAAAIRSAYEPSLKESVDRIGHQTGWSQAERDAYVTGAAETFSDARIPSGEAAVLHGMLAHHIANPPDEATLSQWAAASRKEVYDRYGLDEGNRRLEAAKQFVSARPGLAQLATASGIEAHPRFVMSLVERVGEMRMTPRKR